MITYRYEPEKVEQRHEAFVRERAVVLGPQLERLREGASPQEPVPPQDRRASAQQNRQNHTAADSGASEKERTSMTEHTVHQDFLEQARQRPDKVLFDLPGGRKVTYDQTLQSTLRQELAKGMTEFVINNFERKAGGH